MKRLACWVSICLMCALVAVLGGCGGGGAIKILISSGGIQAIDQGQTLTLTATVSNGSNGQGVTWTITSGPGTLSGASATSVTYTAPASVTSATSVTITATLTSSNSSNSTVTQTFTFTITPPPSLGAGGNLAAGTEGTAYNQSPTVTGGAGTLAWVVQANPNPLPAGLSMNSSTGAITGTPTGPAGSSTFTVQVTDSGNPKIVVSAQFTILINNYPAPTIAPASGALPAGVAGTAYAQQTFTVSGGHAPFTFSIINGSLPAGLTQSSSNNMLIVSGTPSGPACNPCTFSVKVVDSSNPTQTATNNYSIVITLPAPPAITTTQAQVTAAPGTAGTAYSFQFHGTGSGTLTWSATGLPADGLSLNASNGTVSGTPTSHASIGITLTLSDSFGQSSGAIPFTITVNNPPAPTITTTQAQVTAAAGTVGTAYSFTFQATGTGTLTWSATGLPADGLSLNAATGVVSGTPTTHQTVPITLTVSDTYGQSSAATPFTITVNNPAPPVITTTPAQVPSATVNVLYGFTLVGSGYGTLTWSTTPALSDGLSINASTGVISGTPTSATTLNFSVTLTDGLGQQTTVNNFSIVVSTESIAFTSTVPSSVVEGGSFSVTATVSNDAGNGGVDWTVTCGSSPCGSFTANHTASGTATIFDAPATPPTGGTVTIVATAHDAPNPQATAVVTINYAALIITTNSLPNGTINNTYTATITGSGGLPPYTFTLDASSAALPNGLQFNPGSPSATITGTPTATGTTNNIIVDVKDSEGTPMTTQMTYSLTVNSASSTETCTGAPTGHESMLKGQYVFLGQGWKGSGTGTPSAVVVSFAADGSGNITNLGSGVGGEVDTNQPGKAPQNFTINSTSSDATTLYTVGEDPTGAGDLGCVVLTQTGSPGQSNAATFRFSLGKKNGSGIYTKGRIIQFDDGTGTGQRGSGVMLLQTTPFAVHAQSYTYGASGWDASGGPVAAGGFVTVSSNGTISNLTGDFDDAGTNDGGLAGPLLGVTGNNGSIGTPDTTAGRSVVTTNFQIGANTFTYHYAAYQVDSDEYFYISTDTVSSTTPLVSGRIMVTHAAGTFSNSSLNGNYIIHGTGNDSGTASVALGLLTLSGGNITAGTIYNYESGSPASSQDQSGGTYSVATATGRTTSTGGGGHPPIIYVTAPSSTTEPISAFIVGTDSSGLFGLAEASSGSFTTAGLAGNYFFGTENPGDNTVNNSVGVLTIASSGAITGTQDESGSSGLSTNALSGTTLTITNSDGAGNVGSGTIGYTNGTSFFFFDQGQSNDSPAKINVIEKQ